MENKDEFCLRELIRVLVRTLGILEKDGSTCCGVTLAQCHTIVEIGRSKEISLNELAKLLALDKSTMSRTINNLVKNGLVVRESHPEDKRYLIIKLSEKGMSVFNTVESDMNKYYNNIFMAIPEDDREQVLSSLQLLIDAINKNKHC